MELLKALGIDWKLLVAQIVNFLVVMVVLYKFVYRPLTDWLEQRQKYISSNLAEAKQMEEEIKNLEQKKELIIVEAKKQAQSIIEMANQEAIKRGQEVMAKVKEEAAQAVEDARRSFAAEQASQMQALRQQAARLITQALVKLVGKLPAQLIDDKFVEEAIQEVTKRR